MKVGERLRLASIGVPTITPLALGEQRKRKFLFENYLVTLEIAGTQPLDVFLEQVLPSLPENQRSSLRRSLALKLAELTARLHDSGFLHQDFHPGNVLVKRDGEGEVSLAMIDLDALRWRKRLSWADAQANLAFWTTTSGSVAAVPTDTASWSPISRNGPRAILNRASFAGVSSLPPGPGPSGCGDAGDVGARARTSIFKFIEAGGFGAWRIATCRPRPCAS